MTQNNPQLNAGQTSTVNDIDSFIAAAEKLASDGQQIFATVEQEAKNAFQTAVSYISSAANYARQAKQATNTPTNNA